MNTVIVYGQLAEEYGLLHELKVAVRSPLEAVRAIHVQMPGFLQRCEELGYVAVREFAGGAFALTEEQLDLGMNGGTIHIMPCIDGAKKGVGKVILGVALIGASFFIPGSTMILGMGLKTMAMTLGLGLLFAGAAMLLAPTPKIDNGDGRKDDSFLFNGDTNTADQNICVPVTYGYDRVRPIPIATRVKTNEYTARGATGSSIFDRDNPMAWAIGQWLSSHDGFSFQSRHSDYEVD